MLGPLGQVLRDVRETAGLLQEDVAMRAGVHRSVISRLEQGQRWPEIGPDRVVAAYAAECGEDPLALWERAVAQARERKKPPASE